METLSEVGAVEPDALDGVATLAEGELEDRHAFGTLVNGAANFSDDAGRFTGLEFVQGHGILAVFVAKGEVVEEVFGG
jgi:hypothetical protein